jgi:hypothetical protein
VFQGFLTQREPFRREFTADVAEDFYQGVRCGLLHEARTKNGWKIWAEDFNERIIDATEKTLFRNNFQVALNIFIDDYSKQLPCNTPLQEAFIRTFDQLCI